MILDAKIQNLREAMGRSPLLQYQPGAVKEEAQVGEAPEECWELPI